MIVLLHCMDFNLICNERQKKMPYLRLLLKFVFVFFSFVAAKLGCLLTLFCLICLLLYESTSFILVYYQAERAYSLMWAKAVCASMNAEKNEIDKSQFYTIYAFLFLMHYFSLAHFDEMCLVSPWGALFSIK